MRSTFLTLLLLILSTSTTFVYAHADAHAHQQPHSHGLARRSQRDSAVIHIPLEKRSPAPSAHPLALIKSQVSGLSRKYGKNVAAFRKNKPGRVNPDINGTVIDVPALDVIANVTDALNATMIRHDVGDLVGELLEGRSTSGTGSLTPTSDYGMWTGSIKIGTPGVDVRVNFDTGSADTVLNLNQGYDPSKSSTARKTNKSFTVRYADHSGEGGTIYNETVSFAGKKAKGQAIGVPSWSSFAASDPGIVGMAFQSVSSFNRRPLLQTLRRYDSIPRAMFGVALSRTASKAELRIGGYNPSKIKSGNSINWVPVDNSGGFWTVTASKTNLAQGSTSGSLGSRKLILDTGTTLIFGSTADVKQLFNANNIEISNQGDYVAGIYSGNTPPSLSFTIGGKTYSLSGDVMNMGQASTGKYYVSIVGSDSLGLKSGEWLVGDTFFSKVYSVFDADRTRVGLAYGNF
ncbi:acid protease [Jaminaea rosea]|uniref:Acid protease n=1 Tax=Jaminaea rosea TaxID=1569628 RepID=A0A316UMV0_9BASI|nr:acid protease [Jaminaea rosea]PWN26138.1 acid protease [Jaminaea rosea]